MSALSACRSAACCLALLAAQASAQVVPTGTPAADILLAAAISEQKVFLTCSALDPAAHELIAKGWQTDVAKAAEILAAHQVPAASIAAFTAAADPKALLPAEDTGFAELRQFCTTHADWQTTYARLNFTILDLQLPGAFAE